MPNSYTTVSIQGGICGKIWMPAIECGRLVDDCILTKRPGYRQGMIDKGDTFSQILSSWLLAHGGDYQNPLFTCDTVIAFEKVFEKRDGVSHIHRKEILISDIDKDLVREDVHSSDFLGDDY